MKHPTVKLNPNKERLTRSTYPNGRVQLAADNVAVLCRATLDSLTAGKVALIELDNGESSAPYTRGLRDAAQAKRMSVNLRKSGRNILVSLA